ncbi:MAG: biotin/lipoyl-containing protein [Candidatus Hydrogenedentota bacterium]
MKIEVSLPDLGDEAEQNVTVSAWMAKVGAELQEGDDLLEITTDKAAFCVPVPQSGTLVECRVHDDDVIHVGDTICIIEV